MSNFPTVKWKVTADSLKTVPPLLQRASLRGRAADGGGPTTCVSQRAEGRRGPDTYPNPRTVCRCFCCSHKAAGLNLREFVVHPTTMGHQGRKVGSPDCFSRQERWCSDGHGLFQDSESQGYILQAFFFFFLFCGWSRPAGCRFEREHTLVIATKIFKFSQITLAEALSVDVAGHSLNRSRNIHTFAYSSNNFWNLLISLS